MAVSGLAGADELPALLDSTSGGDFDTDVASGLHGRNSHGGMPDPGSGDDHEVQIFAAHHVLKGALAGAVQSDGLRSLPRAFEPGLGALDLVFDHIAERADLHARDGGEVVEPNLGRRKADHAHKEFMDW